MTHEEAWGKLGNQSVARIEEEEKNGDVNYACVLHEVRGIMDCIDWDLAHEKKRLYIKVYADMEAYEVADKIYQICDEDKFSKVIEALQEYKEELL